MISRHVSICYALTCAFLAILVCGCAPAKAAPTAAQGSAATLEVSQIGYELANTIPIGLSATNAQPYVSTEVDTEAEAAPTSLPMTNEEMALAEVAAVVAELATTAAAELKVREQFEEVEKEKISNSRSAEEDRQEVMARVLANVREEGVTVNDDDFIAATTFGTNLPQQINTTPITTTMSPATAQPIVPATATERPIILVELVRAAAAANEILAAALNVATMSATNTNATMATTTDDTANLATTLQPEAASSTTAVADHAQVSDSDMLPEPTAWQLNEFERLAEVTTAIPDYTTTPTAVEDKSTDNASVSKEVNDDKLLDKELESIRQSQTATPIDIQETTIESNGKSIYAETTDLSKVNGLTNTDEEPKRILADEDKEASESMIIEKSKTSQETMASPPPSGDNDLENSSPDAENLVTNTTNNVATQTEAVAESATEVAPVTLEKINETADIEELKFKEDKKEQKDEGEENVTEHTIKTTTTESLETLIAVESEARVPNKIALISEEETLEQTRATTPEQTTIMSASTLATDETTAEDLLTETGTIEATTYTTVAPTILITTTGVQKESISTTKSADIKTDDVSASEQSEQLVEAIVETTATPSPTVASNSITEVSHENQIVSITTTKLPAAEATTTNEEELSTSPLALTENHKDTVQYSLADIETTTNSIEEPITVTRIPFIVNTSTQSTETTRTTTDLLSTESLRSSTDAPSLSTITTLATEEIQHLEASANQANFEAFPNADLTEVSPQTTTQTTDDITTTTLSTSPETTTINSTTTASATQPPVIEDTILDFTKIGSTAELREQMPTTTEELLSTTIITTEKMLESEDGAEPEAKTGTTTSAAIEEQPFQTITEKEQQQQQQQQVLEEIDSTITTTNTIVTTEESTIEDTDVTSSAAFATTSTTTADIATVSAPEVEVTTTVSTTTSEPDITMTTTTTTLSPMSLIVAEHEARSLDRTPPRVSRIVNEDGVEVLTGYSIVHHMHAAALAAALAAEGA